MGCAICAPILRQNVKLVRLLLADAIVEQFDWHRSKCPHSNIMSITGQISKVRKARDPLDMSNFRQGIANV